MSIPHSRRTFLRATALGVAATAIPSAYADTAEYQSKRPAPSARKFRSQAVDAAIEATAAKIADPELAWLFSNCLPNTLDTTVETSTVDGKPDTVVITGDINAMWLRDSSAQVWPYLPFVKQDADLARMIQGLIHRQARCIRLDPYANAFMADLSLKTPLESSTADKTEMRPGVGERKWEVDSLCYPIRLAHGYWKQSGDTTPFDHDWLEAAHLVVKTFREQQRKTNNGPYKFERASTHPTESLGEEGYGAPSRSIGLIHSGFRPSDDACTFSFNIPGNFFAVQALHHLEELFQQVARDSAAASDAASLRAEIESALKAHASIVHPTAGKIWAYEIDGYGSALCMDDANVPSLLGLPYLGASSQTDSLYLATRKFVWSPDNPYFFKGSVAEGIGGPHVGRDMIWPMSITMRALTTHDAD
ncbi:MAG TPA: glycoside hydrolase family 125 protein, partial [Acidobacteriaceae bacterium]